MSTGPFSTALAQLSQPRTRGGILARYDVATGDVKAVVAVKVGKVSAWAPSSRWRRAREAEGWVGVEFEF